MCELEDVLDHLGNIDALETETERRNSDTQQVVHVHARYMKAGARTERATRLTAQHSMEQDILLLSKMDVASTKTLKTVNT